MSPLGVTHVVLSLQVGGLEHVVLNLVRESRRLGQRVNVICLEQEGPLATRVRELGATVHCVRKPPGLKFSTISKVRKLLESLRPHVVHTHQIGALFYGGPAARQAGVPVVVHTEHGKHYARRRTRILAWWAAKYAQRFFCVSTDIATAVRGCRVAPASKVSVVPNGIDVEAFADRTGRCELRAELKIPNEARVIGTVGRLNEIKCQDLLIRAFAGVSPSAGREPHLLLVGDGPMMPALCKLVCELRLEHRVHFAGYQSRPGRFLSAMDVFALTSRSEGMPLVILEAWAAGLPVVASRVGGVPELIEEHRTGLMFEAGDELALRRCLQRLADNPQQASELGTWGRQRVRALFDISTMADAYRLHYQNLLDAAPGRRRALASPLSAASEMHETCAS